MLAHRLGLAANAAAAPAGDADRETPPRPAQISASTGILPMRTYGVSPCAGATSRSARPAGTAATSRGREPSWSISAVTPSFVAAQHRASALERAHAADVEVLVRRRGVAEPRIVADVDEQ